MGVPSENFTFPRESPGRMRSSLPAGELRARGIGRVRLSSAGGPVPARVRDTPFLLVDDDPIDVLIFSEACRDAGLGNPILVAGDGLEALELLRAPSSPEPGADAPIVVLDLKMPRMDGFGFLDEVRRDPRLTRLVVFVLSGSEAASDLEAATRRQVAGYLPKSRLEDDAIAAVRMLAGHGETAARPAAGGLSGAVRAGPPGPARRPFPATTPGDGLRRRGARRRR